MSPLYELAPTQEFTADQRHAETSSNYLRWKKLKLIGGVAVTNLIGLCAIGGGIYAIIRASHEDAECHSIHGSHYDQCDHDPEVAGGAIALFAGAVWELLSNGIARHIHGTQTQLSALNMDQSVSLIRQSLIEGTTPRDFEDQYGSQLSDLVNLGVFPEERVEEYQELLKRYDTLLSDKLSVELSRNTGSSPNLERLETREAELKDLAEELSEDWIEFQSAITHEIPNPLLV